MSRSTARSLPIWRCVMKLPSRPWSKWPARPAAATRQPADGSEFRRPALSQLAYKHQKVQRLRRLVGRRSARQAEGRFVVEGTKVFAEALSAGVAIESVYLDPTLIGADDPLSALVDRAYAAGSRIYELEEGVLARVAGTVTPQAVLAVVPQIDVPRVRLHE